MSKRAKSQGDRPPLIGDQIIADNIKRALEAAGVRPAELARRLGLTPQAVSQWLAAQTTPSARRLIAIAKELNISVEVLRQASIALDQQRGHLLHLHQYRLGDAAGETSQGAEWLIPADAFRGFASDQPDLVIVRVVGTDLEPNLRPGDLVIADRHWRVVSAGGVYLVGEESFPVLRRCELVAGSESRLVTVFEGGARREVPADGLPVLGRIICRLLVPL